LPLERTLSHLSALYEARDDPWEHLSSPYEREKYARTLEAAGTGPFEAGLEVGCGIGALSDLLAPRCRRLVALEAVPAAFARARARLGRHAQVTVVEGQAPRDLPDFRPDLVILSEVLYFMQPAEIAGLGRWLAARLHPRLRVVAVNWTGHTGEALSGRGAADILREAVPQLSGPRQEQTGYILDLLTTR
jgi:SAM-dependent methyltransferase